MKLPRYPIISSEKFLTFEFISEGPKGYIQKIVAYQRTNFKDVYNLAFGDKISSTGDIDDIVISNNGDSEKILSTVVATVYAFTGKYPSVWVYATGSTNARTRLYRMGITKYLPEVLEDFEVFGYLNEEWEPFKANVNYKGFLIRRKFK